MTSRAERGADFDPAPSIAQVDAVEVDIADAPPAVAVVGTVVSLMIPYTVVVLVAWTSFFVVWHLLGIPLGPGYPVKV